MNRYPIAIALAVALSGCKPNGTANILQSIDLAPAQAIALDTPISFTLGGLGICTVSIDWGDGSNPDSAVANFAANHSVSHTFSGWPGGKTVTVHGTTGGLHDCIGSVRKRFTIEPSVVSIGFAHGSHEKEQLCFVPKPSLPGLAAMSLVHITSPGDPQVNFGCSNNGCIYDADGKPGSVAAPPFPFLGLREYSLVMRVGQKVFQGGKSAAPFTVPNGGTLEFCQNTDKLGNNITGGWEVDVEVDQLGTSQP